MIVTIYALGTEWMIRFPVNPPESMADYRYEVAIKDRQGIRVRGPYVEGLELERFDDCLLLTLRPDQTRLSPGAYTLVLKQIPDSGTQIEFTYKIRVQRPS